MQAQAIRAETNQEVLTSQQSLQCIQTLLRAGLGCITYLRNLLPADNFSESYLTAATANSLSSQPSESFGSFSSETSRRNVSGFKIMTVTRGYTEEADKLLDFMENGIFDALQKQYLRSFIFAIYLDNEDPNNIVEAYTFNFHYHTIPGTTTTIPIMTLGDNLMKMSISGKNSDPVANATKSGKVPTLGEVKRSLKTLIKNLIQATTQMDALPKRRFATFKLFYYDYTPDDYEPPHFRTGDVDKDKWVFATHDAAEVPEKCSIGKVQTGWHGVDVQIASVTGYLPSNEDNNAPFLGTTQGLDGLAPPLTPAEEAVTRAEQVEVQRKDASRRRVVWDAEEGIADPDADGECDVDESQDPGSSDSQILETWRVGKSGVENISPLGIRDEAGNIAPLPQPNPRKDVEESLDGGHYVGAREKVPSHVGKLNISCCPETQHITKTQLVGDAGRTPDPPSPLSSPSPSPISKPPAPRRMSTRLTKSRAEESLPPSDPYSSIPTVSSYDIGQETVQTQALGKLMRRHEDTQEDEVMLKTQVDSRTVTSQDDPIRSFKATNISRKGSILSSAGEGTLECECGVQTDDSDALLCDGGCKRWFHVWCMGFHDAKDNRIPNEFICFDCRVKADQNWDLIMVHDLYPQMMERFRGLALFRRAIKCYETHNPPNLSGFSKKVGCESIVAGQLFKRLETEGFIAPQTTTPEDDLGLMETTNSRSKTRAKGRGGGKARQPMRGKSVPKSRYAFLHEIKKSKTYKDYFTPTPEVEKRVLGLANLKPARKSHRRVNLEDMDVDTETPLPPQATKDTDESTSQGTVIPSTSQVSELVNLESQTQDETQLLASSSASRSPTPVPAAVSKRKITLTQTTRETRASKRVKISVGLGVDLGD
ncbi:HORMA-domain-containing protein [Panus rudis PR-1116 ss-1]|nr:HORMA-domain-containing protein [Panus rudis PR-1116 ss-1]